MSHQFDKKPHFVAAFIRFLKLNTIQFRNNINCALLNKFDASKGTNNYWNFYPHPLMAEYSGKHLLVQSQQ